MSNTIKAFASLEKGAPVKACRSPVDPVEVKVDLPSPAANYTVPAKLYYARKCSGAAQFSRPVRTQANNNMKPRFILMILLTRAFTLPASAGGVEETKQQTEAVQKAADVSMERAMRPLKEKHIQALEKLVADKTKAGKLEEALHAKKELAIAHLAGRWLVRDGPIVVTINRNGQIFDEAGNVRGHWEFEAK